MRQIDANSRCEWCHIVAGKCCHTGVELQEERKWLTDAAGHTQDTTFEATLLLGLVGKGDPRKSARCCSGLGEHFGTQVLCKCKRDKGTFFEPLCMRLRHAREAGVVGSSLGRVVEASFPMGGRMRRRSDAGVAPGGGNL